MFCRFQLVLEVVYYALEVTFQEPNTEITNANIFYSQLPLFQFISSLQGVITHCQQALNGYG
jgi:hypothetical protein